MISSLHISCLLELDNAAASRSMSSLEESLNSVLLAAANAKERQGLSVDVGVVVPSDLDASIESLVSRKLSDYPEVASSLRKASSGYFASKNAATKAPPGGYISFTDSDCTYEPDYFLKLAQAIEEKPDAVVYGITFGRSPRTRFQRISQYCWQFPPSAIGYGDSFPRSQWANNLALPHLILERLPFPEIRLRHMRHFETKQERFLWHREVESLAIDVAQSSAVCYHEQIPSLAAWIVRFWEHGKARGLKTKGRSLSVRKNLQLAFVTGFGKRSTHLKALEKSGELPSRYLTPAIMLLALGSTLKILGYFRVFLSMSEWATIWPGRNSSVPSNKAGIED